MGNCKSMKQVGQKCEGGSIEDMSVNGGGRPVRLGQKACGRFIVRPDRKVLLG